MTNDKFIHKPYIMLMTAKKLVKHVEEGIYLILVGLTVCNHNLFCVIIFRCNRLQCPITGVIGSNVP